MNSAATTRWAGQDGPTSIFSVADRILSGLNQAGWDLGVSGFARASGENSWIVFGTRGRQSLHAEGQSPTEALLNAARLAAAAC